MKIKLSEKQIEDVFEEYYEELLEKGLKLKGRQVILENRLRIDLLFEDVNGKNLVLELKRDAITREDIGQIIDYAGLIQNRRVILAAPIISKRIKIAFEHYGIEYLEFNLEKIQLLYNQIEDGKKKKLPKQVIKIPHEIFKEPLGTKKLKDGNIAFKITYVDSDWNGVCSPNVADFNFKNRTWCKIQSEYSENCQSKIYSKPSKLTKNNFPCNDCVAKKFLRFYPGHYHGTKKNNEPIRCLNAKRGKIGIFTSREPGTKENERFIFAIGEINYIEKVEVKNRQPYEQYYLNRKLTLQFKESKAPQYWKYYSNPNNPQRIAWNTGLFRYINDKTVRSILSDISLNYDLTKAEKVILEKLLDKVN